MQFKVAEKFISVNGEGLRAGQLAVFIRFTGCNLNCSYCDTTWANVPNATYTLMDEHEIYQFIKDSQITNVTLTGGEPLMQEGIKELLKILAKDQMLHVEIETNGSIELSSFTEIENAPSFTMDYKMPSSLMEERMCLENLMDLTKKDTLKSVCGTEEDLKRLKQIINQYHLINQTNVYISPVFGAIEMETIVDFMKENQMNGAVLQMQLHKVIWNHTKRGV